MNHTEQLISSVANLTNLGATLTLSSEQTLCPVIHIAAGANAGAVALLIPAVEDYQRHYIVWNASGQTVTVKFGDDSTGQAVGNGEAWLFVSSSSGAKQLA